MAEPNIPIAIAGVSHHTAKVAAIEAFRFADEPALLADATAEQIRATAMAVRDIVESGGALPANERQRLDRMLAIFETACSAATVRAQGLAKRKKAPAPPQTKTARRRAKGGSRWRGSHSGASCGCRTTLRRRGSAWPPVRRTAAAPAPRRTPP